MPKLALLTLIIALSPRFTIAAPALTTGFSLSDGQSALQVALSAIREARQNIDVAAYSLTSKPVAVALSDARYRGVSVRGSADKKFNSGRYSAATFQANQSSPVRLNGQYTIMHNKFMVINAVNVDTGSFKYNASAASRNAENALLRY